MTSSAGAGPRSRARATWADLGVHRLSRGLAGVHAAGLAGVAAIGASIGPPVDWGTAVLPLLMLALLVIVWAAHVRTPGGPRDWLVTETLAAVALVMLASWWLGPAQYLAAGASRPLVDAHLAALDRLAGIDVSRWAAWTAAHPGVGAWLAASYGTLILQFALTQAICGVVLGDREAVWEYAWHFSVCGIVTLMAWALWPAAGAFQHLGFTSTLDQSRFIRHFTALRAGTMARIDTSDLEGLISMPSFHVAGALFSTWAVRRSPIALAVYVAVNVPLIAATMLSGAHYAVDVAAAGAVFAASVWSWRAFGRRWLPAGR